jgi:hypothetical protein
MIQTTNLSIYTDYVRLAVGDVNGSVYSTPVINTALVNAVYWCMPRWNNRYLLYASGILSTDQTNLGVNQVRVNTPDGQLVLTQPGDNDVFRNTISHTFLSEPPPIVEQQDTTPIVLAASYLLRRSQLSSSMTGLSWSTPDLSFSTIEGSKTLKALIQQDLDALNAYFQKRIGRMHIGSLRYAVEPNTDVLQQINDLRLSTKRSSFNT